MSICNSLNVNFLYHAQQKGGEIVFYDVFARLCKQKGVSFRRACLDVGVSQPSVAKWKKGAVPTGKTVAKFAEYFGVTTDYLLEKEEPTPTPQNKEGYDLVGAARQRIMEILHDDGYLAEECLRVLGFKKADFIAWRKGESSSFMGRLDEIADMLDVSVAYLLGKTNDRNAPMLADGGKTPEEISKLVALFRELNPTKQKKVMRNIRDEIKEQRSQNKLS